MERKVANGRSEIYSGDSSPDTWGVDILLAHQGNTGLSLFEDHDPGDEGDADAAGEVDDLFSEMDLPGPYDSLSAPVFEQGDSLPFIAKQRKGARKEELKSVSLEDFEEGAQRWAAGTLIAAVRRYFATVERPKECAEVARWIFGTPQGGASFDNCCHVNETRPDVLRMRIQFELWRRGKSAKAPFDFAHELPAFLSNKALFTAGFAGVKVAKLLWMSPGIENEALRAELDAAGRRALEVMADMYMASPVETAPYRWYLTGINPILEEHDRRANADMSSYRPNARNPEFSWSSRFGDD